MDASNFLAHRAPSELIYAIYLSIASERIRDALALSITCRSLRNQWTAHRSAILWDLCVEQVPHAEEALLAARMTRKVADAEQSGRLPPMDISPDDLLSGSATPKSSITLSEYQQVRALDRLVSYQERRYSCAHKDSALSVDGAQPYTQRSDLPEEPSSMTEWSDRLRLALYRTMIIAAGLAGAYNEPIVKATDHETGMSGIIEKNEYHQPYPVTWPVLTAKEVDWLEQFTVCSMNSTPEADEGVFGRVARWLLGNILTKKSRREAMAWRFAHDLGRATYCRRIRESGRDCPVQLIVDGNGTWAHSDAHLVVWEMMQVLAIFISDIECDFRHPQEPGGEDPSRHALAVFPESYVVLELQVPENFEDVGRSWPLLNNSPSPLIRPPLPISRLLQSIHDRGGRPNTYTSNPPNGWPLFCTPHLNLKFFEYFLSRYCRLRFDRDAFSEGLWPELNTWEGGQRLIFANDHVWGEFTREAPKASNPAIRIEVSYGRIMDGDFYDGSEGLTRYDPAPTLKYTELEYFYYWDV